VWLHGRIDADYDLRDLGSLAARGSNLTAAMTVYLAVVLLFAFTCGAVRWAMRSLPNRHRSTPRHRVIAEAGREHISVAPLFWISRSPRARFALEGNHHLIAGLGHVAEARFTKRGC
jgi:hypothetical protein